MFSFLSLFACDITIWTFAQNNSNIQIWLPFLLLHAASNRWAVTKLLLRRLHVNWLNNWLTRMLKGEYINNVVQQTCMYFKFSFSCCFLLLFYLVGHAFQCLRCPHAVAVASCYNTNKNIKNLLCHFFQVFKARDLTQAWTCSMTGPYSDDILMTFLTFDEPWILSCGELFPRSCWIPHLETSLTISSFTTIINRNIP